MKGTLKTRLIGASIGIFFGCVVIFSAGMNAQAKTIELSFSHHLPPMVPVAKAFEQWAKRIEADTDGRVAITIYPSGTLSKESDAYASTVGGICDISFISNSYERKRWALNQIVNLLDLPIPTDARGTEIWDRLWEKYPVMLTEYEGVKVLSHSVNMSASIHTQKEIRVPADIKGMKIAALGDKIKLLQNVGAAPIGMPANDWYLSLEKGVIDGLFCPVGLLTDRGIEGLVPYHLKLDMGQSGSCIIMNMKKWNSLPPDIQSTIEQLYTWGNETINGAFNRLVEDAWAKCRSQGHTIIEPTAEEMKLWQAAVQETTQNWIKENANKGPTQEMYEYAKKLLEVIGQ